MKFSNNIKTVSYLKANASRLIDDLAANHGTVILTRNGQAQAIMQDIETYEKTQESLALLKMLAQSKKDITVGDYQPLHSAFAAIKKRTGQL